MLCAYGSYEAQMDVGTTLGRQGKAWGWGGGGEGGGMWVMSSRIMVIHVHSFENMSWA